MNKLYSACYSGVHPFDRIAGINEIEIVTKAEQITTPGILIVWGGGDISPSIYGKKVCKYTGATENLSQRDAIEVALMKRAIELGYPIIGVCRGAQMLCALAGGHLIQHVNHHAGHGHMVDIKGGGKLFVNTIHHQMMYPFNVEHELRAWISKEHPLSDVYYDENELVTVPVEPEYVYFPKIKGFAVQWHPEGMRATTEANLWLLNDIETQLGVKRQ